MQECLFGTDNAPYRTHVSISFATELNHITYSADLEVEFKSLEIGDVIGESKFGKVFKALWPFSPVAVQEMKIGSARSFDPV